MTRRFTLSDIWHSLHVLHLRLVLDPSCDVLVKTGGNSSLGVYPVRLPASESPDRRKEAYSGASFLDKGLCGRNRVMRRG